jgi:hypothetical protein
MSNLARTLILTATVAALNLPGMAAVAQASDEDTTTAAAGGAVERLPE